MKVLTPMNFSRKQYLRLSRYFMRIENLKNVAKYLLCNFRSLDKKKISFTKFKNVNRYI